MRKLILLVLLAMVTHLPAQIVNAPFLAEGKTWNYMLHHLESNGFLEDPFSLVVRGDTIIGGVKYKTIYRQASGDIDRLSCMLREEDEKVYKLDPNDSDEYLLFDFGRNDVGVVSCWDSKRVTGYFNWMISSIDTVQVGNNLFRRYCCRQQYSDTPLSFIDEGEGVEVDYWVARVGSSHGGITRFSLEIPTMLPGVYSTFVSCYENGECIFTSEDFTRPTFSSGILDMDVKRTNRGSRNFYDLQGKCYDCMAKTGIYIHNGKKFFSGKHN